MNQLNQVIVEGNVVKEPEKKSFKNGGTWCTIPIAVNRTYKTKEGSFEKEVSYFDIDAFGNFAELCLNLCPKGRGIRVVGRLKQERWDDNEGKKHSKVKILAEHIEFKPVFNKDGEKTAPAAEKQEAQAGKPSSVKQKAIKQLAEAAAAAQNEQEKGEEVVF